MSEEMEESTFVPRFEFDEDFQTLIAACVVNSVEFNQSTVGLIKPEYFQDVTEGIVVDIVLKCFKKTGKIPTSYTMLSRLIDKQVEEKRVKSIIADDTKECAERLLKTSIADMPYVIEETVEFARHAALGKAIMQSAELIDKRDFSGIERLISAAMKIGAHYVLDEYDFFGEKEIAEREKMRIDKAAGILGGKAYSTGVKDLDEMLYHKGWAKQEFYVFMGAPKSGKSTALAYFAKNLSMQGHNVLFVTLEVSRSITADRIDASITGTPMKMLQRKISDVREKVERFVKSEKCGRLEIEERPTGTMTPNDLEIMLQQFKNRGVVFDAIVVDYADIMAPNIRTKEPTENSKSIYVDLRAIAQKENVIMISATQTNRDGAQSPIAKMHHVSDDFNKIRIPDLVISINATEEEKADGIARLFFVASRNQESGFSLVIKQRLEAMQFIVSVIGTE